MERASVPGQRAHFSSDEGKDLRIDVEGRRPPRHGRYLGACENGQVTNGRF